MGYGVHILMETKYNLDKLKATGVLFFVNGRSWIARAIRFVEGNECTHLAGAYFDNIECKYKIAEMVFGGWWFWRKGGLKSTELEKWIKKNKSKVVEIASPQLDHVEKKKLDEIVMRDVKKGKGYDIGGLFGFLHKKFRKLNHPELFFCSEYWMVRLKEIGRDISPGPETLESPQDVMRMIGKTLTSILNKAVKIEEQERRNS